MSSAPDAQVAASAVIHEGVKLGEGCVIEDGAVLGKRPRLRAGSRAARDKPLDALVLGDGVTVCCGAIVYVIDASGACFTTSTKPKRTSTRPSPSGRIDPTTTASALRDRHTAGWISSMRVGRGETPL